MQEKTRIQIPGRLVVLVTLARLLEQLERSVEAVSADQYRSVVQHLILELVTVESDDTFNELLSVFPAMSELYENSRYEHAGLCRSPLHVSLETEIEVKRVLAQAARPTLQ